MTNSFVVQLNFHLSLYLHFWAAGVIIFGESTGMWVRGFKNPYTNGAMFCCVDIRIKIDADASFFVHNPAVTTFSWSGCRRLYNRG